MRRLILNHIFCSLKAMHVFYSLRCDSVVDSGCKIRFDARSKKEQHYTLRHHPSSAPSPCQSHSRHRDNTDTFRSPPHFYSLKRANLDRGLLQQFSQHHHKIRFFTLCLDLIDASTILGEEEGMMHLASVPWPSRLRMRHHGVYVYI